MKGWSAFTKETNLPEEEQQIITEKMNEGLVEPLDIQKSLKEFKETEKLEKK